MHSEQCGYCGKWVCHKPILGTLHFCYTEDERAQIDYARRMMEAQKRAVSPYFGLQLDR